MSLPCIGLRWCVCLALTECELGAKLRRVKDSTYDPENARCRNTFQAGAPKAGKRNIRIQQAPAYRGTTHKEHLVPSKTLFFFLIHITTAGRPDPSIMRCPHRTENAQTAEKGDSLYSAILVAAAWMPRAPRSCNGTCHHVAPARSVFYLFFGPIRYERDVGY
ncbi:hypothetical protein QR685DRAFT_538015 [Neurospora intermedia]|uniref:Secreted protein n=1 Tax=Neurospora intermedia TaxID=5142 RepID=A0ABR3CYN1_NEUIN